MHNIYLSVLDEMYKLVLFLIHLGYCNGFSDGEQAVINNKIQQMELEIQKLKADISSFKKGKIAITIRRTCRCFTENYCLL